LGRRQKLDDGILQVNVITKLDDSMVRRLLRSVRIKALPNNERYEGFSQWETIKFKVASKQRTIVVGVDGEREAYKSPVTVTCMAGALRLFVPAEGIRSRPHNLFSLAMLKELFRAARGNA
jgi:diacylglycerol kinase family enzyme